MNSTVKIDSGILEGTIIDSTADEGDLEIALFQGIPFAAPPTGSLRWCPPRPVQSWDGIRKADKPGPCCSQVIHGEDGFIGAITDAFDIEMPPPVLLEYSEDCLYLNVWTTDLNQESKQPVMVWIHGGGHKFGTGSTANGSKLVQNGIVLVTINYRLGALGFMSHPALTDESEDNTSGNQGMLDQIAALEWVKRNISVFGGDPDNVTIFGESAGSHSVCTLMISPLSKGLFHRAIGESGVGTFSLTKLKTAPEGLLSHEQMGVQFGGHLGVAGDGAEQLKQMRQLDVDRIVDAGLTFPMLDTSPFPDGVVLPESVGHAFQKGNFHDVPLIIGSNADEGTALYWGSPLVEAPPPIDTVEKYVAAIKQVFGSQADDVLNIYPAADNEEMLHSSKRLLGDSLFGAPASFIAQQMSSADKPVYLYFFTHRPTGKAGEILGSFHAYEIGFVYGTPLLPGIEGEDDQQVSRAMMGYWVQFAKHGNPNREGLPEWRQYDSESDEYMAISAEPTMKPVERRKIYNLLQKDLEKKLEMF